MRPRATFSVVVDSDVLGEAAGIPCGSTIVEIRTLCLVEYSVGAMLVVPRRTISDESGAPLQETSKILFGFLGWINFFRGGVGDRRLPRFTIRRS